MQAWGVFYATVGGAAAALLGLLFVAVSINATAAIGPAATASRRLTEQAFQNYITVMAVALLALFPDLDPTVFGWVIAALTMVGFGWGLARFLQAAGQRLEKRSWLNVLHRHVISLIGFGLLLGSALAMAVKRGDAHAWLAVSVLILVFSATMVSWELLTQIADKGRD